MATATATKFDAERARARIAKVGTQDLKNWAESTAMNLQAEVTRYLVDGDVQHVFEAIVLTQSMTLMLDALAERSTHQYG